VQKRNRKNSISNAYKKRKWSAKDAEERALLDNFFKLVNSKLTVNESTEIPIERMSLIVSQLKSKEVDIEDIRNLDSNSFYEFLSGEEPHEEDS